MVLRLKTTHRPYNQAAAISLSRTTCCLQYRRIGTSQCVSILTSARIVQLVAPLKGALPHDTLLKIPTSANRAACIQFTREFTTVPSLFLFKVSFFPYSYTHTDPRPHYNKCIDKDNFVAVCSSLFCKALAARPLYT